MTSLKSVCLLLPTNSLDLCECDNGFRKPVWLLFRGRKVGVFGYLYLDSDKIYLMHIRIDYGILAVFCRHGRCRCFHGPSWMCAITNRLSCDSVEMSLVTQFQLFDRCSSHFFWLLSSVVIIFILSFTNVSAIKLAIFTLAQQICPHTYRKEITIGNRWVPIFGRSCQLVWNWTTGKEKV